MSRFPLIAGLLALPILAGVGGSISIAQNANDDAAKAALSAGFSKLKAARPDTAAQVALPTLAWLQEPDIRETAEVGGSIRA